MIFFFVFLFFCTDCMPIYLASFKFCNYGIFASVSWLSSSICLQGHGDAVQSIPTAETSELKLGLDRTVESEGVVRQLHTVNI